MKYEKTQKGNPHELTIKQHSFPARSIERFSQDDGCVTVYLIEQRKNIRVKPDDQIFCAKRNWDQRAESGYMKEIEDKYQNLVNNVFTGNVSTITSIENQLITDMFILWNIRAHRNKNPIEDHKIEAIDVLRHFTKDDQELLEKNDINYTRPDLSIPGRQLSSIHIQNNLFEVRKQMNDIQWGILRASDGQFIVPDNFSNARMLPVAPNICFSQSHNDIIDINEVAQINRLAIESSCKYYFANDLSKCPK